MKIQTRIAIIFAIITAIIISVASSVVYYFANQNAYEDFYRRMELRTMIAARNALEADEENLEAFNTIRSQHLQTLAREREYVVPVNDIRNHNFKLLDLPESFYNTVMTKGTARLKEGVDFYTGLYYEDNQGNFVIILSARNEVVKEYLANLRSVLLVCLIAAPLAAYVVGRIFSKLILRPINHITARVKDISVYNLHLRLESDRKDEISELTTTFNHMLDRLETAFETQNNFVSNASHELNTPLTTIIGETEYALQKLRSPEKYQESLSIIQRESEKLHNITKSLLHLAQTGFNGQALNAEPVRIDEILYNVQQTVDNIFPDNKVYINHSLMPENDDKLVVNGNPQLLELAFANVVLNACKYSSNKPVQILLAATNSSVMVLIKDEGIGIPKQEIKYVFDPFFRASNTNKFKGYGIGLPLARNIVRLHSGNLIVRSEENQGTEIQIDIPLASEVRKR
ncbi:MAG: HAMP domain-containing histidine kinase [Sphingobacteriales bacterium]|nr:MAG: HAMP domain-containing histidine kinase [Sphingobacteriales bacterium]